MADIELVIKISEEKYKKVSNGNSSFTDDFSIHYAIKNGIPLPKGHGVLKDFEKIYADMSEKEELARQRVIDTPTNSPCYMKYMAQLNERAAFKEMLYNAEPIIEADKEQEEWIKQ